MTPYYQDDHVTIYHADARTIDDWLTADVLVTDPPYGMEYRSNMGQIRHDPIAGDGTTDMRDTILRMWGDRPALVFGTWRVTRPACRELLVWNKTNMGPGMGDLKLPWGPCHEEIYVIGDGFTGKRSSNVLTVDGLSPASADRPDHPTPKPLGLMTTLLAKCPPGIIADPFMGSGTTLRAAKDLDRHAIGVELDERYCERAARRMAQETLGFG